MYGRKLTKEELMDYGINEVTTTGRVFRNGKEVKPTIDDAGYFMFRIYDKDENGNKIKIPKKNTTIKSQYTYKTRAIGLHRLMWAWHYGEVEDGMVVDHISNSHTHIEDYYLNNLQLMTPGENIAKERDNWHVSELRCNLSKPRSHFEQKLEGYTLAYENAKANKDAEGAHKLRSAIAQTRARLRYYDSHIAEYRAKIEKAEAEKKAADDCHARAKKRKDLQYEVDRARLMYLQLKEAYGEDDPIVYQYWGEWKLAIAMLHGFKEECKKAKENKVKS